MNETQLIMWVIYQINQQISLDNDDIDEFFYSFISDKEKFSNWTLMPIDYKAIKEYSFEVFDEYVKYVYNYGV